MDGLELLLAAHALATIAMTGVVWFVQLVHYPLFVRVGAADFAAFHQGHVRRTGRVVVPLMVVELATASLIPLAAPPVLRGPALAGLAVLAAIWGSTFLVQVPLHRRLEASPALEERDRIATRLVNTNWVRTLAWSVRSVLAVWLALWTG